MSFRKCCYTVTHTCSDFPQWLRVMQVTSMESTAGEDSVSFSKAGLYFTSHWGFPNCFYILLSQPQEQSHLIHDEDGGS